MEQERLAKEHLEKRLERRRELSEEQEQLKHELFEKRLEQKLLERPQVGDEIDVVDSYNKWFESVILQVDGHRILIHYKGFSHRWDEWINVDIRSEMKMIALIGTHSRAELFDPSTYVIPPYVIIYQVAGDSNRESESESDDIIFTKPCGQWTRSR